MSGLGTNLNLYRQRFARTSYYRSMGYPRAGALRLKTSLNAGVWALQRPKDTGVLQGIYLRL